METMDAACLQPGALVGQFADAVEHEVDDLLADGVVTTGIVVGSILLAGDDLLRVVQLAVSAGSDLVTHSGLKIDVHGTRNVLSSTSLREEGIERVIATADSLVGRHLTVRLDAVLQAVQLPTSISGLDTGLTNMNRKAFTHF